MHMPLKTYELIGAASDRVAVAIAKAGMTLNVWLNVGPRAAIGLPLKKSVGVRITIRRFSKVAGPRKRAIAK
jgi:hypothetical protein